MIDFHQLQLYEIATSLSTNDKGLLKWLFQHIKKSVGYCQHIVSNTTRGIVATETKLAINFDWEHAKLHQYDRGTDNSTMLLTNFINKAYDYTANVAYKCKKCIAPLTHLIFPIIKVYTLCNNININTSIQSMLHH